MTADKSTANFSFFYFFFRTGTTGASLPEANNCSKYNQAGHAWFQLVAFGCVSEQLFRTRQQQARASLVQLVNLGTGRTIVQNPTGCVTCWTPNPEQLLTLGSRWRPGCPETEQLFGLGSRLNQAGQEPEKRTMTVFCGFGGSPKPEGTRHTARTRGLGNPEPDCPRHPRKCFLLIYGFYATMFYRIWVVMGSVRYFHAFMGKFLKFL